MITELLYQRRSVRKYQDKKISKELLGKILEAGRLSPSGNNEQPWLFGVIDQPKLIEEVANVSYKQHFIKSAPLVIALCTCPLDTCSSKAIEKARFTQFSEMIDEMDETLFNAISAQEHQAKIPGTHMVLEALHLGIGSTWVSYYDVQKMNELLKLPKGYNVTELIAFGYPSDHIKPREKKSIEEITFINQFKES